jgi:hypothetical protein
MSAGAAAGGDAGQVAQGEAQGDGGGGDAPDTAQIAEMLAAQQASQDQMYQYLQSQPWAQQEEQAPEQEAAPELDLSFLDMDSPEYNPEQVAQRLGGLIESTVEQRVQQGIQQAVTPIQQQQDEMRRQSEVQALVGEFPEIADQETGQAVLQMATQLAQAHGQPDLANEPWFWRLTYMAGRAADAAQEESGETPAAAHLEGGAGAAPAGGGQDMGDAIVGARRGNSVLPFG